MGEAALWYERHLPGLGEEFLVAVEAAVAQLEQNPRIGSRTPGVADESVRRVVVRRFPYHVVYIELPDRLQVLAVAHDRRRPAYWLGRLSR